jgi:hypothetical protein
VFEWKGMIVLMQRILGFADWSMLSQQRRVYYARGAPAVCPIFTFLESMGPILVASYLDRTYPGISIRGCPEQPVEMRQFYDNVFHQLSITNLLTYLLRKKVIKFLPDDVFEDGITAQSFMSGYEAMLYTDVNDTGDMSKFVVPVEYDPTPEYTSPVGAQNRFEYEFPKVKGYPQTLKDLLQLPYVPSQMYHSEITQEKKDEFVNRILEMIPRPKTVLDWGSGTGWLSDELAKHDIKTFHYDPSDGTSNWRGGVMDLIVLRYVLHHSPGMNRILHFLKSFTDTILILEHFPTSQVHENILYLVHLKYDMERVPVAKRQQSYEEWWKTCPLFFTQQLQIRHHLTEVGVTSWYSKYLIWKNTLGRTYKVLVIPECLRSHNLSLVYAKVSDECRGAYRRVRSGDTIYGVKYDFTGIMTKALVFSYQPDVTERLERWKRVQPRVKDPSNDDVSFPYAGAVSYYKYPKSSKDAGLTCM